MLKPGAKQRQCHRPTVERLRFKSLGGCSAFEFELEEELAVSQDMSRIVDQNDHFIAYVPCAALSPFYLRIIPRKDGAHFHRTNDKALEGFAEVAL